MLDRFTRFSRQECYDIAYFGDFRWADAATSGVAEEIAAHARVGYRAVLVQVDMAGQRGNLTIRTPIRSCLERGEAAICDISTTGLRARLAILHDPISLTFPTELRSRIQLERAIIVINWPVFDTAGNARFDISGTYDAAQAMLGCHVEWAPASPQLRQQFAELSMKPSLLAFDWNPVIDVDRWRAERYRPRGRVPVAGRHSRPEERFWPDGFSDLLGVYPTSDTLDIKLLGVPSALLQPFFGNYPSNWTLFEFDSIASERFLRSLDFFLYSHAGRWPHTSDRGILEALASGAVAVLPPRFAPSFGEACVYANPGWDSLNQITSLHRDPDGFREQVGRGREFVTQHFSPQRHIERLERLIGRPRRRPNAARRATAPMDAKPCRPKRPVLFTATNGIGLGHLTQLLAIAKRLPSDIQPIFATMSQAISVVRAAGYPTHFFPDYRYTESSYRQWNDWLEVELSALIEFYDIHAIVFDGVIPYDGIVRAGSRRSDLPMIWVRIPMWKRALWDDSVERAKFFDLVLDTGELAGAQNVGARIPYEEKLEVIPPMLLCDENELLAREEARARLGLDMAGHAVLLQLGSGNNQALVPVVQHIVSALETRGITQVVIADWVIAERPLEAWPSVKMLRNFPNSHYLRAFDFVISAAGYNTFHELIGYGVPAVFVPNEKVETDDQLGRSRFAEAEGLGFCMPYAQLDNFEGYLDRLLDPAERARMTHACRTLRWDNGAYVAADRIAALMSDASQGWGCGPEGIE